MKNYVLVEETGLYLNLRDESPVIQNGDKVEVNGNTYKFRKEGSTYVLIPVEEKPVKEELELRECPRCEHQQKVKYERWVRCDKCLVHNKHVYWKKV